MAEGGSSSTTSTSRRGMSPASFLFQYGYKLGRTVGEGSYAKVKVADCISSGGKVAIKIINRKRAPKDFIEKFLPRELHVIQRVSQGNIVQIFNIFDLADAVFIIMEYADGGDLLDHIKGKGALPEPEARRMFKELCSAIKYCHSLNICHRDLKCENLLLDKEKHIKVSDFGFARSCIDPETNKRILSKTYCGSAAYASPEVLQGIPYNPKMYDVWSLGCILYIMVCGSMPYDDSNVKKMLKTQLEGKVGFPSRVIDKLSREVKHLIHHMLEVDITRRATLDQVLKSDWINRH
ncbi:testis-specific serine/threonine-protein kinase 1-like [Tubulanus polymorphus]|uniref:testis-specific serine/threonine-protein kinase 1-like n=1 Tax=Tubulanus polymorphus TaxID=672921 RepID=UPI003DA5A98E